MNARKTLGTVVAAMGLMLSAASSASAEYSALANSCVPLTSADAPRLVYNAAGVRNTSASIASIMCNAGTTNSNATTSISVFLVDNHPNIAVACRAVAVSHISGAVHWSQTKTAPNGTTAIGFDVPNLGGAKMISVECSLPQISNGNSSSIISVFTG